MHWNKILTAKMDNVDPAEGEWGFSRTPPTAVCVKNSQEPRQVVVLYHVSSELVTFREFVEDFAAHHPDVRAVSVTTDDAAIRLELGRFGIHAVRATPTTEAAELVVPDGTSRQQVEACSRLIKAAVTPPGAFGWL